ncbi:glycoside hydrolase superfamily, partial [Dimargaris cristalligena]
KRADGACPSLQEIKDDLNFLGTNVSKNFRIYSLLECNQGELILQALRGTDYKVILGMWVGKDDGAVKAELAELSRLITTYPSEIKQSASAVLIGSESLYRKDVTEPQLIAYIKDCRNVLSTHQLDGVIPVTTAETYDWVLPDVAAAVDYVTMNAFPFWEGKTIDEAKQVFFEHYEQVKGIAKDKRVVIGETGWPTAGKPYENVAIPSLENNKRYIQEFVCEAHKRQIDYYWFASFDEPWKHNENGVDVEANWGLTYEDRRKFKIDGDF